MTSNVDFRVVRYGALQRPRRQGTDRSADPAGWEGNPWGPRRPAGSGQRRHSADPDDPADVAVGQVGQAGAPRRRHPVPSGRMLGCSSAGSRSAGSPPTSAAASTRTPAIVAIEDGRARSSTTSTKAGVRRQPFAVWILDNVGPFGVKRRPARVAVARRRGGPLLPARPIEDRSRSTSSWSSDDQALYCVEMTEKAYRSSGLSSAEPVRLGDMENVTKFPICMFMFLAALAPDARTGRLLPGQRAARDLVVSQPG